MTRRMGKTPKRGEASSSGTETMSPLGSPEWISGAQVNFKTPNSAVKQTRNRRTSVYQGRKSPQKQDIDSKQTPNGRFKVPVPFVISPPGVKTRARRSSIYQKARAKNLINVSFSPPKEGGTHARATRKTSLMVPETRKSPKSTSRRTSMVVPGKATKKNSSPVTHARRTFRSPVYVKHGTENNRLTSVIEKVDIVINTPSEAVIIKAPTGKKSPDSSTKKRRKRSVSKSPGPDKSPAAKRARTDQEAPSATPSGRQSSRKTSKAPSIRAASKTPKRWNIPEQTSPPIEVIVFEVKTPDMRVAETAIGNKSANKVTKTPATKWKSTSPKKGKSSPMKSRTPVKSPASDGKSPDVMLDRNSSAKKRRKSPIKCPSPKKIKTPGKHQVNLKSPSDKVNTPAMQQINRKPKWTPAEKMATLPIPASVSPESRSRKSSYSTHMSTSAVLGKNSSFAKSKRSASPLKQDKQQTPSVGKKSELSSPARTSPSAGLVKSAEKTVQEVTTFPSKQDKQQTPSVKKKSKLSSPAKTSTPSAGSVNSAEKTVQEVTTEISSRRKSCYSTPMGTSGIVGKNSSYAKRKRSASPSNQDKQQTPSVSKRSKLSSPTRTSSTTAGSVKSPAKNVQEVTVEISHLEQKLPNNKNNQKGNLTKIKTSPKKQKANKSAKVKSKRSKVGKKSKTLTMKPTPHKRVEQLKSSLEKTTSVKARTPTPGRPRKDSDTDGIGFIRRKKLIEGDSNGEKTGVSILKSEISEKDGNMQSTSFGDNSILNTTISTDSRSSRCIIL